MSWHNAAIIVPARFAYDLPKLFALFGLGSAQRKPELDDVLGGGGDHFSHGAGGLGVITRDGWTFLIGCAVSIAIMEKRIEKIAERTDVFAWELEGGCGYGFYQWWKNGELLRHWEEMEGNILSTLASRYLTVITCLQMKLTMTAAFSLRWPR